ncbi:MAG: hypothetical protein HY244_00365 [Rhizobiales bacterium]|nr:hypothetical protein [Hyphomicrobiales bacterium]
MPNTTKTTFIKQANIPPEKVLESLVDLDKADFDVTEKNLDGRKVYTISKEKKQWKFVLLFGGGPRVMSSDKSTVMNDRRPSVSFDFRSVDGMVYYLGELLRLQRRIGRPLTVPGYQGREDILFNVEVNALADPAHNITADFLGDRYSISRHPVEGDRTLTVLSLLSQVFSLYRQEKDLPKTSAVTVVGAR